MGAFFLFKTLFVFLVKIVYVRNMKTSELGINLIKITEGLRLNSYRCSARVLTIGYGHTKTAKENQTITPEQAENLLKNDLIRFENYVNDFGEFEQYQFDALVCFAFNIGSFGKSFKTALQKRDYKSLIHTWFLYVNAGGVKLLGLQRRRAAEIALFTENYNDIAKILNYKEKQLIEYIDNLKKK